MSAQPEALRLALELKAAWMVYGRQCLQESATELRRLHEVLQTVIAISSYGGLAGMSEGDALTAIRGATQLYRDKSASREDMRNIITKAEAK